MIGTILTTITNSPMFTTFTALTLSAIYLTVGRHRRRIAPVSEENISLRSDEQQMTLTDLLSYSYSFMYTFLFCMTSLFVIYPVSISLLIYRLTMKFLTFLVNHTVETYYKWCELSYLMSKTHKTQSICKIIYYITKLVVHKMYNDIVSRLDNSIEKHPELRNAYFIKYTVQGKEFKMFVVPARGPCILENAVHIETDNDITEDLLPYLGPHNDWHGDHKLTPRTLGYRGAIIITYRNSDKILVAEDKPFTSTQ